MERETSDYVLRAVTKAQLKVLIAGGAYTNKQGCLTRPMNDGRLEIVMLRSEVENLERLYAEVDAEAAELDKPSAPEIPELPVAPAPPKDDGIPDIDKQAWSRMGMDKPPIERENNRPRGGGSSLGGGRINLDGLFNR